jgi:hypothetical protein
MVAINLSAELSGQINRPEVRVSLQHLKLPMARDRANLCNIETLFEQTRDRLMPQIVKVEIRHSGARPQGARRRDGPRCRLWEIPGRSLRHLCEALGAFEPLGVTRGRPGCRRSWS